MYLCMQLPSWSTVYADHKRESQDELSVKKGEIVGLVEDDSFDVYWKVCVNLFPTKNIITVLQRSTSKEELAVYQANALNHLHKV